MATSDEVAAWRAAVRAEAPPIDSVTAAKVARILRGTDPNRVPTETASMYL